MNFRVYKSCYFTIALLIATAGSSAFAQTPETTSVVGQDTIASQYFGFGSLDEESRIQALDDDKQFATDEAYERMIASEDYIFPTSITDNWHVDFMAGASTTFGSYCSQKNLLSRSAYAASLAIGKYVTPVNDLRFNFNYGMGMGVRGLDNNIVADETPEKYAQDGWDLTQENEYADYHKYHWQTVGFSLQWLPNITNLIKGYEQYRKFTVSAVVGIGIQHTFGYSDDHLSYLTVWSESETQGTPRNLVALQFGGRADYMLSKRWHLSLEMVGNFIDDSFDGLISDQKEDIYLNTMVGLTYYIQSRNQRMRDSKAFGAKYAPIQDDLSQKRSELDDALNNRKTEIQYTDVTKNVIYTLISFDRYEVDVPRLQQNNVYQTAQLFNNTPDSRIFITNSSKEDDATFHDRAWNISKLLNQRWQIPLKDVWIDADESNIQKLQIPEVNNYIILIINE